MPIRIKQNKIKNDEKALLNLMAGLKKSKTCHFLFNTKTLIKKNICKVLN